MCEICQHWALITGLCPRVTRNGHLSVRAENVRSKSLDNNQKWKNLRFTLFFAHCVNFFLTTWQIEFGQFVVKRLNVVEEKCLQNCSHSHIYFTSRLTHTRWFQQVRVDGGLWEGGGGREAGQLVDGRGRARCWGGARATHVGAEIFSFIHI